MGEKQHDKQSCGISFIQHIQGLKSQSPESNGDLEQRQERMKLKGRISCSKTNFHPLNLEFRQS